VTRASAQQSPKEDVMTAIKDFTVREADQIAWGHLVKAWAKGEVPQPASIDELRAQCAARGISVEVPEHVTELAFVQNDKHVLTVRLPPKDVHLQEERGIADEAGYALPSWYGRFFRSADPNREMSREEKLDLHAARVGEYSVNNCG
jgi:hypothetical protein